MPSISRYRARRLMDPLLASLLLSFLVTVAVGIKTQPHAAAPHLAGQGATPVPVAEPSDRQLPVAANIFTGKLLSREYYAWHYRWHRGAAWVPHETPHPCHAPNVSTAGAMPTWSTTVAAGCNFTWSHHLRRVFHLNTTILPRMGFLEVQYDLGREDPADGDFIGIYCVDEDEPPGKGHDGRVPAEAFVDYVLINATRRGSFKGRFTLGPLVNMRCSYQLRYLRRVAERHYRVLSESAHVEMEAGHTEPVHVHLALTERPDEMRVMWTTGRGERYQVQYWSNTGEFLHNTDATTTTYAAGDMCSMPATIVEPQWFRHPGYMHESLLTGLVPGKTYSYKLGSAFGISSQVFNFTFPPATGSAPPTASSQSFFVFGDLGHKVLEPIPEEDVPERHFTSRRFHSRLELSEKTVMRRIEQDLAADTQGRFVGVVHIGDLSYAKGRTFLWDQFGSMIEPVAARLPYMVGIGNHEYDYLVGGAGHDPSGSAIGATNGWHPATGNYRNDSKGECGVPTVKRFHMPDNGNNLFWYSFKTGLTHHIILSSEHNCSAHSPMRRWLVQELRHHVNRTETPWLLVHIHRPLYCSENYQSDYSVSHILRGCLEHLFMKYHVDVVFSGHYHAYERTCAVYREQCRSGPPLASDPRNISTALAPTHIMIGSGGAELDDMDYMDGTAWSLNRQQEYGYGRFHVFNTSHAHFEFVRSRDYNVSDDVWIVSKHNWEI